MADVPSDPAKELADIEAPIRAKLEPEARVLTSLTQAVEVSNAISVKRVADLTEKIEGILQYINRALARPGGR